jgi:hypothetical protein
LSIVVLETALEVIKCVTKRYSDGRTLSLLVVDEKLAEKSLTYSWKWDFEKIMEEKEKGVSGVTFKYWEKEGWFGSESYLFLERT